MMALLARLLARPAVTDWLIRRALRTPYTHIKATDGKGDYMRRYWLFNPYPAESSGAGKTSRLPSIRLHHIRRPDPDRHLHDHPWDARTFILRGVYREIREGGFHERWPGDTGPVLFGQYHRITKVSAGGVWTLFVTYKYQGEWGFLVDGVKVLWRTYLGLDKVIDKTEPTYAAPSDSQDATTREKNHG